MKGTVYLYHFSRPYKHAQHYIGWTNDTKKRDLRHRRLGGSKLLRAVRLAGIQIHIVREWHDVDRHFERRLKRRKNSRFLCPICREKGKVR